MTHLKGLIVGIANNDSIAWGCAKVLHEAGCELAITYQNEKTRAYIEPLVNEIACPIVMPLDVREADQMDALFERSKRIGAVWISLSTRLLLRRKAICRGVWWIVPAKDLWSPWTFPAIHSFAWLTRRNP
ncbi:enoyl-[acyl-carrier-protein] reductase, NADH-dependent [Legionella taurinensis]|nr:enoyl-[acyl-carrier-protein] reductase, NADH-dependent [Legionella taurinensis]